MVRSAVSIKKQHKISFRGILNFTPSVKYSSFMRWKGRLERGQEPKTAPGPKKAHRLDFNIIQSEIKNLEHSRRRSHGTGPLYYAYKEKISRRKLASYVQYIRKERLNDRKLKTWELEWLHPNLAWSMDDAEGYCGGTKYFLHNVQDLCSSYKLRPVNGAQILHGEKVAENLEKLFSRFGPPLFLKRDNGSNLCCEAVNEVLEKYAVIPLTSPPGYPQYNGAVEHSQGEYKNELKKNQKLICDIDDIDLMLQLAAHDLNHKPRRRLHGKNSCSTFFREDKIKLNKHQRKEVFLWIKNMELELIRTADNSKDKTESLRIATQAFLATKGYISIKKKKEVSPTFYNDFYS